MTNLCHSFVPSPDYNISDSVCTVRQRIILTLLLYCTQMDVLAIQHMQSIQNHIFTIFIQPHLSF